jgi:hypothetical protein
MGGAPPYLSADELHLNSFANEDQKCNDCLVTAMATRWQVQKSDWSLTRGQVLHSR